MMTTNVWVKQVCYDEWQNTCHGYTGTKSYYMKVINVIPQEWNDYKLRWNPEEYENVTSIDSDILII